MGVIGRKPNQVPVNGFLGTAAFINAELLPVSLAVQTLLDTKLNDAPNNTNTYGRKGAAWVALTKADVALSNVDNTADSAKNVLSATKLTTARTINGVSFDGTANITVADATKLPLTGGTVTGALQVSGVTTFSSLAKALSAPASTGIAAIGYASVGFEATAYGSGATAGAAVMTFHRPNNYASFFGIDTDNKWKVGGYSAGAVAYEIYHQGNKPTSTDVGLGNVNNTSDASKVVASAAKLTTARTIGGVSFDGTANINLPGVNAAGTQNTSGSAATLTTARSINGTSFNGSADITTSTWGTARDVTIGSSTKSVNGSAAVNWTLSEIGAASASALATKQDVLVSGTNIKTINSQNITGSGNITISGSGGLSVGDLLTTTRALVAPDYLPASGGAYTQSSYTELYAILGLLPNSMFTAKLTVPYAPGGSVGGISWTSDALYMAAASSQSPYLWVYSRSGTTLTKLNNPSPAPGWIASGCAIANTSSGVMAAVAFNSSPYISIYTISGSSVTKLTDPSTLPTSSGQGCDWDGTGTYLAVVHGSSPYVTVYERSGTTFTKLANPSTLPVGATSCCWDASGKYLVVGASSSPYIYVYERSGTTLTKLANPSSLPVGGVSDVACDATASLITTTSSNIPYVATYRRDDSTLTKLTDPSTLPTGAGLSCSWNRAGTLLSVGHSTSPYVTVYQYDGSTFTKQTNPASLPSTDGNACSFASNGAFLALGYSSDPYLEVYNNTAYDTSTSFIVPNYPTGSLALKNYIKAKP